MTDQIDPLRRLSGTAAITQPRNSHWMAQPRGNLRRANRASRANQRAELFQGNCALLPFG